MRHFMKNTTYISLLILIWFASCNKPDRKTTKDNHKETLLIATQNFSEFKKVERTFKIFSDSTFLFTESLQELNHSSTENFRGKAQIINDTIKFFPFELDFNEAETAVLKNGFIEFIDGEFPFRMQVNSSTLEDKKLIDYSKFEDYSVFTFYKKFQHSPEEKKYVNFDLNTKDLAKIEVILKEQFIQNKNLNQYSEYIKQIESVKNEQNENLIFIRCFCKNSSHIEGFRYNLITMHDGGNCNIFIKLNLSKGKIEFFNIAGFG